MKVIIYSIFIDLPFNHIIIILLHFFNFMTHLYFTKDSIEQALKQPIHSRDILIYMHPKDFLSVAMSGHSQNKLTKVQHLFKDNIQFNEIPFLNFVHDGEGTARVTGHEGRHRAKVLLSLNIIEMPVLLKHRYDENGQAMLWHNMNSHNNQFYDMWPERLYGERGSSHETNQHSKNYISFPIDDLRLSLINNQSLKP